MDAAVLQQTVTQTALSRLEQATLKQATLKQTTLGKATLGQATLAQATPKQAMLKQATLKQTTLKQNNTAARKALVPKPGDRYLKVDHHFCALLVKGKKTHEMRSITSKGPKDMSKGEWVWLTTLKNQVMIDS